MPYDYPLLLDVRDRQIVIVGGGAVAARKVEGLLSAGATRIRVVSPTVDDSISQIVERITERYRSEHLRGAQLVFAATNDSAINDSVVRDARERGVLVCRADVDDDHAGDFATPAMIRRGPVLVTVSTAGSPALAAIIRDAIDRSIDPRWIAMAEAMQTIRPKIRKMEIPIGRRREIFRVLASDQAIDILAGESLDGLIAWLVEQFPELKGLQSRQAGVCEDGI